MVCLYRTLMAECFYILLFKLCCMVDFETIYKKYFSYLTSYASHFVPDSEVADIVSESFCSMLTRGQPPKDEDEYLKLLYTRVRNRCLDYLKTKKVHQSKEPEIIYLMDDDWAIKQRAEIEAHLILSIRNRLESLAPQFRRVIDLAFFEHHTNAEICEILGVQDRTVRSLKSDALRALKLSFFDK